MDEQRHSHARTRPPRRWRAFTLVVGLVAGALFVTSYVNAGGQDLRASSVSDLNSLVRERSKDTDSLQERVADLNRQVEALSGRVDDADVRRYRRQAAALKATAGMTRVSGAGLTVTLDDAPEDVADRAIKDGYPPGKLLVVHQQDLQAVVNALWLGGARAISLMGQRLISTSGVKCVGPSVLLQGVPYTPPYVIRAVGDPARMRAALDDSDFVAAYRKIADAYGLGYGVTSSYATSVPGYEGPLDLRYASPLSRAG